MDDPFDVANAASGLETGSSQKPAGKHQLLGERPAQRLAHLAALKMVLFGESAIDLARLWFDDVSEINTFLRLHAFDPDNYLDLKRLDELHHEATVYLTDVHRFRLPLEIEQPGAIHELFLAASLPTHTRLQRFACMTLKIMHILHHISGRELLFNTPISEAQLFESLGNKVFLAIDKMRAANIGVAEFAAGKKSRVSIATKLLAKRDNLATHIFDKLRFRIVVNERDDLVFSLLYLLRHLVPFNYVLPEQSLNTILSRSDVARVLDVAPDLASHLWPAQTPLHDEDAQDSPNEFSADSFRTINFIADIPIRIDDVAPNAHPAIAFVQTEIQLMDAQTAATNEKGDSAHSRYKKRQRSRVRSRLLRPATHFAGELQVPSPPEEDA